MKEIRWERKKSETLKRIRGFYFEEIIQFDYLGIDQHRSRKNQMVMFFKHNNYIWVVPCIIEKDHVFLKTAFPSRKYTKEYKKGRIENEEA